MNLALRQLRQDSLIFAVQSRNMHMQARWLCYMRDCRTASRDLVSLPCGTQGMPCAQSTFKTQELLLPPNRGITTVAGCL